MSYIDRPVIISGIPRSGTSMTAGVIDICGSFGGKMSGPTRYNRKGMFENTEVRNQILKPFLKSMGYDPMGQKPLPNINAVIAKSKDQELTKDWSGHVLRIFKRHGYDGDSRWYYKEPKVCLVWPIWHAAFPEADWVIVRRDAEDIVRSCLKTSFMRAYSGRSGWLGWVSEHEARFEEMVDAGLKIQEVWPQRMINGDFTGIQNVVNNLGLEWDDKILQKVKEFVEPKLWNKGQGRQGKAS